MEENTKELVVYVLLRTDLPSMNPGKAAAQVHHAGVQMMAKHGKRQLVQDYVKDGIAQGAVYFNTTLVLGATLSDIIQRGQEAENAGDDVVVFNTVTDPSYPFFVENAEVADLIPESAAKAIKKMSDGKILMVREEVTCAWFCGDRNDIRFCCLFEGLNLHP
jgi:hypothetical protein